MTDFALPRGPRLLIKKSIEQIQYESGHQNLKRTLGPVNLVLLGIGCIIGAGIYVMTGNAAANFAGPAVILSFVVAGLACAFAGLCYAELASSMPVAGSAYTYSYTTLGEVFAWVMGWLLVLEYGVSAAVVAAGWSGTVTSLLANFGLQIPPELTTSFIQATAGPGGATVFTGGHGLNLLGSLGILGVTALLVVGISESASVNNIIVGIKVGVLLVFIAMGALFIHPSNWHPFIPKNEGGLKYGTVGIFRAASTIFFAYVGFEAVSTAAAEAKNPARDMPIGILGSLAVCTILYIVVAAVLTGMVPFHQLGGPAPIALAVDRMGPAFAWFAILIKIGAVAGLSSVMLILTYGQSRVFFAMARDGLLPSAFSTLHAKFRTPWIGTMVLGVIIAIVAALLPIDILGNLVSLGTAVAFGIVCISVLWLRKARPDLHRPFRAPGGIWTPILGIVGAAVMAGPLLADMALSVVRGDPIPAWILAGYVVLGTVIYIVYGHGHSRLAKGLGQIDADQDAGPGPMQAGAHGVGKDHA
jgi:APA family basic amino acid/polyamine antiporter